MNVCAWCPAKPICSDYSRIQGLKELIRLDGNSGFRIHIDGCTRRITTRVEGSQRYTGIETIKGGNP